MVRLKKNMFKIMKTLFFGAIRILNAKSIRRKMFYINVISIIIPLIVVGELAVYILVSTLESNAISNNNMLLDNMITVVDNNTKDMERLTLIAYSDKRIQEILSRTEQEGAIGLWQQIEDTEYMDQLFMNLITLRNETTNICIFNNKEFIYKFDRFKLSFNNRFDYKSQEWFKKGKELEGAIVIVSTQKPQYLNLREAMTWQELYVYSVFRQINSFSPFKGVGYILVSQSIKSIDDIAKKMNLNGARTIIADEKGNIVYNQDGQYIQKNILELDKEFKRVIDGQTGSYYSEIEGEKSLVTYKKSSYSGWIYISILNKNKISENSTLINYAILSISLACILVFIILSAFLSYLITKPIKTLMAGIKEVAKGNFLINIEKKTEDEFGELIIGFNGMTQKINNLIQSEYKSQLLKREYDLHQKETELASLRSQINPHFLYNTLESIRTIAALNKDEVVAEMIYSLAMLFRMSIKTCNGYIPLKKEIELINCYVYIQNMRYDRDFQMLFNVEEELKELLIPSFILQPLVENSFQHGFEPKEGKGTINISAYVNDKNDLVIEVSDDGVGIDENTIDKLNSILAGKLINEKTGISASSDEHVGIINVNKRIRLCSGDNYGLRLETNQLNGVTVKITLPVKESP